MPFSAHEIKHDPGIELAAARAHRQPVERGKSHRRCDGFAIQQRAHGGAVAQMGDDDTAFREGGRDSAQTARDEFVGQSMETIAPNSFVVKRRGSANVSATKGWLRWKAVSKQAT